MTRKQVGAEFFAAHTVTELRALERLRARGSGPARRAADATTPSSDTYVPISWDDAFALVGETLRGLDEPEPGGLLHLRAGSSNEATFLYQLWVRELGTNNLPDCSNMCHEASGRALTAVARHRQGHVRPERLGAGRR